MKKSPIEPNVCKVAGCRLKFKWKWTLAPTFFQDYNKIFRNVVLQVLVYVIQSFSRQFADELFECNWPFCEIGA